MKGMAKTRAIGGSLVVTIPREIVEDENLKPNELVEIEVEKPKKSFFGVARGVGPFTEKDELKGHD